MYGQFFCIDRLEKKAFFATCSNVQQWRRCVEKHVGRLKYTIREFITLIHTFEELSARCSNRIKDFGHNRPHECYAHSRCSRSKLSRLESQYTGALGNPLLNLISRIATSRVVIVDSQGYGGKFFSPVERTRSDRSSPEKPRKIGFSTETSDTRPPALTAAAALCCSEGRLEPPAGSSRRPPSPPTPSSRNTDSARIPRPIFFRTTNQNTQPC